MKPTFSLAIMTALALFATADLGAQNVVEAAAAPAAPATTTALASGPSMIYRQIMPDGSVVYSDKAGKVGKVEHAMTFDPPIKGNLWTAEPSSRANIPDRIEHTRIVQAPTMSYVEKKKIADQAASNVIRAEMLLEDAKRQQEDGVEPLPGERTGNVNGTSRLNQIYQARQQALAKAVTYAESNLKRARDEQAALR